MVSLDQDSINHHYFEKNMNDKKSRIDGFGICMECGIGETLNNQIKIGDRAIHRYPAHESNTI